MRGCQYCEQGEKIHFDKNWNVRQAHKYLWVWNYTNQCAVIQIPINFCMHCGRRLRRPNEYEWGKCEVKND